MICLQVKLIVLQSFIQSKNFVYFSSFCYLVFQFQRIILQSFSLSFLCSLSLTQPLLTPFYSFSISFTFSYLPHSSFCFFPIINFLFFSYFLLHLFFTSFFLSSSFFPFPSFNLFFSSLFSIFLSLLLLPHIFFLNLIRT